MLTTIDWPGIILVYRLIFNSLICFLILYESEFIFYPVALKKFFRHIELYYMVSFLFQNKTS